MKALKHPGICKICGEYKEMSPEHIPPKHAFNSTKVMILPFEELAKTITGAEGRKPWELQGLKGTTQQGGYKKYCLCHSCNNDTGQWYMRTYTDIAKTVHTMIVEQKMAPGFSYSFKINNLFPLRLYKAVMTLMCDINNDCFGDDNLRQELLNKERQIDTSRYSVYMYLVSGQMPRMSGIAGILDLNHAESPIMVSEIALYPLGFAMYLDKPKNYIPWGFNIDHFASYCYDQKDDIKFELPYIDINSQLPADYRSKDAILDCVKSTNDTLGRRS